MAMQALFHTANALGIAAAGFCPAAATAVNSVGDNVVARSWARVAPVGSNTLRAGYADRGKREVGLQTDAIRIGSLFAEMRALQDGWDGYGAVRPREDVLNKAAQVLGFAFAHQRVKELPRLVPIADGGIQAEWFAGSERFEIYFEADGEVAAWTENRANHVEYEADGKDAVQLLLNWLHRSTDRG